MVEYTPEVELPNAGRKSRDWRLLITLAIPVLFILFIAYAVIVGYLNSNKMVDVVSGEQAVESTITSTVTDQEYQDEFENLLMTIRMKDSAYSSEEGIEEITPKLHNMISTLQRSTGIDNTEWAEALDYMVKENGNVSMSMDHLQLAGDMTASSYFNMARSSIIVGKLLNGDYDVVEYEDSLSVKFTKVREIRKKLGNKISKDVISAEVLNILHEKFDGLSEGEVKELTQEERETGAVKYKVIRSRDSSYGRNGVKYNRWVYDIQISKAVTDEQIVATLYKAARELKEKGNYDAMSVRNFFGLGDYESACGTAVWAPEGDWSSASKRHLEKKIRIETMPNYFCRNQ